MNKIDAIKLSVESENFAQRRTGRKGSTYYNGLAAGYREGYLNGFAEAGRQFLKTSQTNENQQSTEQLLLKNAVIKSVCDHEWEMIGDPDKQACRCIKCNEYNY